MLHEPTRHSLNTHRFRTAPELPKKLLGVMYQRTTELGRCFFGFVGGRKILLLPDHGRVSGSGEPVWKLYETPLSWTSKRWSRTLPID